MLGFAMGRCIACDALVLQELNTESMRALIYNECSVEIQLAASVSRDFIGRPDLADGLQREPTSQIRGVHDAGR